MEKMEAKFGPIDLLDNFEKSYKPRKSSLVLEMSRADVHKWDKKWKPKTEFDHPFKPVKKLDDKYLIKDE